MIYYVHGVVCAPEFSGCGGERFPSGYQTPIGEADTRTEKDRTTKKGRRASRAGRRAGRSHEA